MCWQFRLVMSLYAATYMVANSADSVFERRGELLEHVAHKARRLRALIYVAIDRTLDSSGGGVARHRAAVAVERRGEGRGERAGAGRAGVRACLRVSTIVKDVRGSESNCEQDSRKM